MSTRGFPRLVVWPLIQLQFPFQAEKLPSPFASSAFRFSIRDPEKLTWAPKWGMPAAMPFTTASLGQVV